MDQSASRPMAICLVMAASAFLATASDSEGQSKVAIAATPGVARAGVAAASTDLQPFTRTTYIPAGADLSSIRFESIKATKVATARVSLANRRYCEPGFSEPGGSLYCPYVKDESPAPAYRVTYSYSGPPTASDEYAGTGFTFSVDLRLEDLSPAVRQAISGGKISRAEAATLFALTTARGSARRVVIDETHSTFCDGRYTDGAWTQTEANCVSKVSYKTVAAPSGYIAVKVDPAPAR